MNGTAIAQAPAYEEPAKVGEVDKSTRNLALAILYWLDEDCGQHKLTRPDRKNAESRVRWTTASFFVSAGVIAVLTYYPLRLWGLLIAPAALILALRLLYRQSFNLPWLSKWGIAQEVSRTPDEWRGIVRELHQSNKGIPWTLSVWEKLTFFRPFSFQNIWWWTLWFSLLHATTQHLEGGESGEHSLAIRVSAALVIAAIAYIATNLINQLLELRDEYNLVGDKVRDASATVDSLNQKLESQVATKLESHVAALSKASSTAVGFLQTTLDTSTELAVWKGLIAQDQPFSKEAQDALREVMNSVGNYGRKILEAGPTRSSYVSRILKELLVGQVKLLNTKKLRCLTSFSTLSTLASEIVSLANEARPEDGVEVHALIVLPPLKFLNYDGDYSYGAPSMPRWVDENKNRCLKDRNWFKYLCGNAKLAGQEQRNFSLKRHFLAVKADKDYAGKLERYRTANILSDIEPRDRALAEILPIQYEYVRAQLDLWVKCTESGEPVVRNGAKDVALSEFEFADQIEKVEFVISAGERPGETWLALREVIGARLHAPGSAFVLEYDGDKDRSFDLILDDELYKIKDFIAVGRRVNREVEWELCLRSLYDRDFEVASVEIVHPGLRDRWNDVKSELDALFGDRHHDAVKRVKMIGTADRPGGASGAVLG